ncbi:hypothetical protein MPTK2_1g10480 [Marchantia polymorpha subsp. ruderalis]
MRTWSTPRSVLWWHKCKETSPSVERSAPGGMPTTGSFSNSERGRSWNCGHGLGRRESEIPMAGEEVEALAARSPRRHERRVHRLCLVLCSASRDFSAGTVPRAFSLLRRVTRDFSEVADFEGALIIWFLSLSFLSVAMRPPPRLRVQESEYREMHHAKRFGELKATSKNPRLVP